MTDFRALHRPGDPLLLPNAWDVASALALAGAGFAAIGTTSLGVAAAHGLPDGQGQGKPQTGDLVRALRGRLAIPLTVDIEGGFGGTPDEVAGLAAALAADGAAGINLEDGRPSFAAGGAAGCAEDGGLGRAAGGSPTHAAGGSPAHAAGGSPAHAAGGGGGGPFGILAPVAEQAALIAAVKARVPGLFVNARIDTYWLGVARDETLARAHAYLDAGADGIFVPAVAADDDIRALTGGLPAPVNILLLPGMTVARLAELGVARVSTGSMLFRAALSAVVGTARAVAQGAPAPTGLLTYAEANALGGTGGGPW